MKRCKLSCTMCPYVKTGTNIENKNFTWKIRKNVDCNTTNVIYMIECTKETCKEKYIGKSERRVKKRFDEHRGYVKNKIMSKATGSHFNKPGHNESNMSITVLEKVKKKDIFYRKERESYLIRKFNTYYQGMNKQP